MCKECKLNKSEKIIIDENVGSQKMREHLLSNIKKYMIRFNAKDTYWHVQKSPLEDKRLRIHIWEKDSAEGSHADEQVDFGYKDSNGHAETFIDLIDSDPQYAINKKRLYMRRASKITNKDGKNTFMQKWSPNSFSYWLLWHCEMCH